MYHTRLLPGSLSDLTQIYCGQARQAARVLLLIGGVLISACTPTVQVAMPNEPITINLNVKIEHEILVKVDKEIDGLLKENSNLF